MTNTNQDIISMRKTLLKQLILIVSLTGLCACSSVKNMEMYNFSDKESDDLCEVTIINETNILLYPSSGGNMMVGINNMNAGKLKWKEYIKLYLPKGEHTLYLEHRDLFIFKSEHKITLTSPENYIFIKASPISNSLRMLNVIPQDFEKEYKERKNDSAGNMRKI
ncbi:MAG: Uncharacterized protein FD166_1248 [Bacteroidetes bacterium]|nr:MAG: Uncharacterized protein FD166_1248 [Bacteroidota bacterium]